MYRGEIARGEVDLYNSSGLVDLLTHEYGYSGSFFTGLIKKEARGIVEQHGGYWVGAKGDSAEYIFGDLGTAVRCTESIMRWVDTDLTEYVKDHVAARQMLSAEGRTTGNPRENEANILKRIELIRKIKDKFGEDVPDLMRDLKNSYEELYAKIDSELRVISSEMRGRIVTKAGIAIGGIDFHVEKRYHAKGQVEINRDPQGEATYLLSRLTDKSGPLSGQKDKILVSSYKETQTFPDNYKFGPRSKVSVANSDFHIWETWGVDHFGSPDFDGRIPGDSLMLGNISAYRVETGKQVDFLKELEESYMDASIPWLDVTCDNREGTDRYKSGRSLMVAAFTLAIIDQVTVIYNEYSGGTEAKDSNSTPDTYAYLTDVRKDATFTGFIHALNNDRNNMVIAALTYSNGGSLSRANSYTPQYPTRRLKPEDNGARIANERKNAVSSTGDYPELVELGIPDILECQDKPISAIRDSSGYNLALKAQILRMASRYVHHLSDRSWKQRLGSAKDAIYRIRGELSDLVDVNTGYNDRYFQLVEHAFTNALGITGNVQFVPVQQRP